MPNRLLTREEAEARFRTSSAQIRTLSAARDLMETHLAAFFEAVPAAIPRDLVAHISPLYAMGMAHGLSITSAGRLLAWLRQTGRADQEQANAIALAIHLTEEGLKHWSTASD